MTLAELRAAFGVSQATASAKARVIANALRVTVVHGSAGRTH
jgi:hypothetical protein